MEINFNLKGNNGVVEFDHELTLRFERAVRQSRVGEPGVIRVSSLGGCLYHAAWAAAFPPEVPTDDDRNPLPAALGNAWEDYIVKLIRADQVPGLLWLPPPDGQDQHKVEGSGFGIPALKGHMDGIVMYEGSPSLLEVKLQGPWPYRKFVRGEMAKAKSSTVPGLEANFPQYALQVQMYMGLMNLPACLFLSSARDYNPIADYVPFPLVVHWVAFDEQAFDAGLDRASRLQVCIDKGIPPACERGPYCPEE